MSAKNTPGGSFTSLRIIGEKAQRLLKKAKQIKNEKLSRGTTHLPPAKSYDEVMIHISTESVVKATFAVLAIGFGVIFTYALMDTIVILLLGVFVAAVIDPGVNAMRRSGIPRGLGILIHYFIALTLFVFLIVSFIPIIAKQLIEIADLINKNTNAFLENPSISLPLVTKEVNEWLTTFVANTLHDLSISHFTDALQAFGQNLSTTAQGTLSFAAHVAGSVFAFFFNLILVLVLAFFIQIEKDKIIRWARSFFPARYRSYIDDKTEIIQQKIGQWARGQLVLCFSIGLLVFLALTILRVPYSLTLAILAGFTEFIPYIGPIIAAVPAILIATTERGLLWGLVIFAVYYVIQWCENNLIVPLVMKRAVGLSAVAIMIAMLVGVSFPLVIHPVLGIILSIPVTTIIALFLDDWRSMPEKKS